REWGLCVRAGFLQNDAARDCFAPGGEAPRLGGIARFPDLARTLRELADGGRDAFYRGAIGERIARFVAAHDGLISRDDLAAHRSTLVEPISTEYRGYRLFELPPSTQGVVALVALNLLGCFDV